MRSINGSFLRVIILRDADSNDPNEAFNGLKSSIDNFIDDPNRFPLHKPSITCSKGSNVGQFASYNCMLKYENGDVALKFIIMVPSLESFLSKYGYINDKDNLNKAIDGALNDLTSVSMLNSVKRLFDPCLN